MAKLHDIQLPIALKERLAQGHPWVYRTHVPAHMQLPAGTWVRARCGGWSGYALWDANGPIALRIFSTRRVPDAIWMRERVQTAWDLRAPLRAAGCTGYRWLFGEGDGLPGLTVDRYSEFAVVQTYMEGTDTLLEWLLEALNRVAAPRGILLRTRHAEEPHNESPGKARLLWGSAPPRDLVVQEYGLRFQADLQAGQKTGLFFDQRENRRFVEGLSAGRSVLNCFAYTGGFSVYALHGGAQSVVSVDIGRGLAEAAAANIELNKLDPQRHSFLTEDCFDLLARYAESKRRFDLLILDPPSFAKSKQNRYSAIRAYTKLNALALRCVAPGGLLISASCTSQIGPETFKEILAAAGTSANRRLQIIHEAGQPLDHPVPAHFPEGRYLKFVVAYVHDLV